MLVKLMLQVVSSLDLMILEFKHIIFQSTVLRLSGAEAERR